MDKSWEAMSDRERAATTARLMGWRVHDLDQHLWSRDGGKTFVPWFEVPRFTNDPEAALAIVDEVLSWPSDCQEEFGRLLIADVLNGYGDSGVIGSDVPRLLFALRTGPHLIARAACLAAPPIVSPTGLAIKDDA